MSDRLRILVVDDEPDISIVLRTILEPEYEVVTAVNGLDALLKLPQFEPDLMIVDMMMPLMDGWQLAAQVRRHPDFHDIPLVFLTALSSEADMRRGYETGANVYLTKPFDPERIMKNLRVFAEHDGLAPRPKRRTLQEIRQEELRLAPVRNSVAGLLSAHPGGGIIRKMKAPSAGLEGDAAAARERQPVGAAVAKVLAAEAAAPAPLAAPGMPLPPPIPAAPLKRFPIPPRVMVVDDDPCILEIIRLTLQNGFEVVTAMDGFDALTKIPGWEPDIFIIDGMMPKMSGFQLLQLLRQTRDTLQSPVLFLSAKSSPRDREYARGLGANEFLAKPFDPDKLIATLERFITQSDFKVRHPKKKPIEKILEEMGVVQEDEEEKEKKKTRSKTIEVLEEFLRRYGDKDPLQRPEPPGGKAS